MPEWRTYTLGEVTKNFDSVRVPVKSAERLSGPYPYYGASGVVDHVADFLFDGEFLLIAEDGENLRTRKTPVAFMAQGKFWVNNHAHVVQGNHLANTRFLCYTLSRTDISGHLSGSTQPKLTQASLNAVKVKLPDRAQQDAVVSVLGALDEKIAVNERIVEVSRDLAQNLYLSVLSRDQAWEIRSLGAIATVVMGQSPRGEDCNRAGEGSPLLNGPTEFGTYYPDPAQWTTVPTRVCGAGDLLLCVRGSTTGRMNWADRDYVIGRGLSAIRANSSPQETRLIYYALLYGMSDLLSRANGSVFPNLSRDLLQSFPIRWPVEAERRSLTQLISATEDGISTRNKESRTLATLRDTLLPQLMSGRLRVKEAEKIVEDAT
jgi:type I restriction enzyme, S subunit